jgi:hypothetical protein
MRQLGREDAAGPPLAASGEGIPAWGACQQRRISRALAGRRRRTRAGARGEPAGHRDHAVDLAGQPLGDRYQLRAGDGARQDYNPVPGSCGRSSAGPPRPAARRDGRDRRRGHQPGGVARLRLLPVLSSRHLCIRSICLRFARTGRKGTIRQATGSQQRDLGPVPGPAAVWLGLARDGRGLAGRWSGRRPGAGPQAAVRSTRADRAAAR